MKPLTQRQAEIAERVASGLSNKEVAHELGVSVKTVEEHIREAAQRIPGDGWPRHRMTLWFLNIQKGA